MCFRKQSSLDIPFASISPILWLILTIPCQEKFLLLMTFSVSGFLLFFFFLLWFMPLVSCLEIFTQPKVTEIFFCFLLKA